MVQITKANFIGMAGPAGGPSPSIVGDPQAVQTANAISSDLNRISNQLGAMEEEREREKIAQAKLDKKIQEANDEMAMQNSLAEAEFAFGQMSQDRMNMKYNEDGSPAYKTMGTDLTDAAKAIQKEAIAKVPAVKRDKFNLLWGNTINKTFLKGRQTARDQAIEIATGDFENSYDLLKKDAALPKNRDNLPDNLLRIKSLLDQAVQTEIIDPKEAVIRMDKAEAGIYENVYRQMIDEDPISAQALLRQPADKLRIDPLVRIDLLKVADQTIKDRRSTATTLETQKMNGAHAQIDTFVNGVIDSIKDSDVDAFDASAIAGIEAALHNMKYQESFDDISDPQFRAEVISKNISSAKYVDDQMVKIKNAYRARTAEARKKADRYAKAEKRAARGLSWDPAVAKEVYTDTITDNSTPVQRMQLAAKFDQPQPELQNSIVAAMTTGQGLANWTDQDGNTQMGYMAVYQNLLKNNPRVLKGMSDEAKNKMAYLGIQMSSGVDVETALDIMKNKFDNVPDSLRASRLHNYRTGEAGQSIRQDIEDRVINNIAGVTSGTDNATPQLRHTIALLGEQMFIAHGDWEAAADAVTAILSEAGETMFPVRGSGGIFSGTNVMAVTPEKHMGWNENETEVAINKMKKDFKPWAEINGIELSDVFIESDERTMSHDKTKSWAIWGKTKNGNYVKSDRRYVPDDQKTLDDEVLLDVYKKNRKQDETVEDFRNRWGLSDSSDGIFRDRFDEEGKPKRGTVEIYNDAKKELEQIEFMEKWAIEKSEVDAVAGGRMNVYFPNNSINGPTLPDIASMFYRDAESAAKEIATKSAIGYQKYRRWAYEIRDTVALKLGIFFNDYIMNPLAGDANAATVEPMGLPETLEAFGEIAVNDPERAEDIFIDAQSYTPEPDLGTEVDVSDIDGVFNTTGKSAEQVEAERMARLMEDTRQFTAASNPAFSNRLEESQFEEYLQILQDHNVDPKSVFTHAGAMKYLSKLKPSEMNAAEDVYYTRALLREEKMGAPTPDDRLILFPNAHKVVTNDPLLYRIYSSEAYRPRVYSDTKTGKGKLTIGIGWNIDKSNDKKARETVNWLNNVNGANGGTIYNLEAMRAGMQTLSAEDAVAVLQHQVAETEKEAMTDLGKAWETTTTSQQRVIADMVFQMGIGKVATKDSKAAGFKAFTKFRAAIKSGRFIDAPMEILDSTAAKQQTPLRFARHFVAFVGGGKFTPDQKKSLKAQALKWYKNHKVVNVSGNDFTQKAIDIINKGL